MNNWILRTTLLRASVLGIVCSFVTAVGYADCFPAPSGLVSWWTGEGNGSDTASTNNGSLQGNMAFAVGEVGQAFLFNGFNAYILVPPSADLNVGPMSGLTIECWINPANTSDQQAIFEWNDGNGNIGVHLY